MSDSTRPAYRHLDGLIDDPEALWNCCWGDDKGFWWSVDEIDGVIYTHCLSPSQPQGPGDGNG